jgi:hypothetical protein
MVAFLHRRRWHVLLRVVVGEFYRDGRFVSVNPEFSAVILYGGVERCLARTPKAPILPGPVERRMLVTLSIQRIIRNKDTHCAQMPW